MARIIHYSDIKPYIEKKLVSEQVHPEDPAVRIFNYTQTCQFSQSWDDITRQCRGLIMNVETGEILARPFPKFFNYGEHVSKGWAIPTGHPIVSEKLDGSLGIMYTLKGKTWIATRGSFTSDQAIWATNWWRDNNLSIPSMRIAEVTHLFEIIYPENRIVVAYDFSGLVHLTSLDTKTGLPVDVSMPVRKALEIDYTDMETLEKMDEPNSEGFVLYYPDDNVRMKIKFPEYVRLHRIVTGINEIAIWEMLRDGKWVSELVEKVPDEFFVWVKSVSARLLDSHDEIADAAEKIFESVKALPTRKDQALAINKMTSTYAGVVFALLDGKGKEASQIIWKMVRPHGSRVFKTDIDL